MKDASSSSVVRSSIFFHFHFCFLPTKIRCTSKVYVLMLNTESHFSSNKGFKRIFWFSHQTDFIKKSLKISRLGTFFWLSNTLLLSPPLTVGFYFLLLRTTGCYSSHATVNMEQHIYKYLYRHFRTGFVPSPKLESSSCSGPLGSLEKKPYQHCWWQIWNAPDSNTSINPDLSFRILF